MKKFLSLALALLLVLALSVSFTGCGKTDAPAADGSDAVVEEEAAGVDLTGSWAHDSYVYTFNADGTGEYDAAGTLMPLTYEVTEEGQLSILFDGNTAPMVLDFSLEGDTLTIVDSFGEDVVYNKQ